MTRQAQELLRAALALPAGDRADFAAQLLASLHGRPETDQQEVEEEWAREIERRARRAMAGESNSQAWTDVRARLADRFVQR